MKGSINMKGIIKIGFSISLLLCSEFLAATPIRWTFNDVVFNDSTRVTGSYVYNADMNEWSDWNITVESGSLSAFTYTLSNSITHWVNRSASGFLLVDHSYRRYINFNFLDAMTNDGGTIALDTGPYSNFQTASWECNNCRRVRWIKDGSVTSVDVDEPGVIALLALGSLCFGFFHFKRNLV